MPWLALKFIKCLFLFSLTSKTYEIARVQGQVKRRTNVFTGISRFSRTCRDCLSY